MFDELSSLEIAIVASGYLALMATSGKVVNYVLFAISKKPVSRMVSKEARDTGFVVGKCENLLILTFMFLGAYTALALIFTAKALVRREDMSKNSLFFLAGTMINVTYSVIIGIVIRMVMGFI